ISVKIIYSDGTVSRDYLIEVPRSDYSDDDIDEFAITNLKTIQSNGRINSDAYGLMEYVFEADPEKEAVALNLYADSSPELWVFGISALVDPNTPKLRLKAETDKLTVSPGTTDDIILSYDLNGDVRADNFHISAETSGRCFTIGEIVENKDNSTFTITVHAGDETGSDDITFTLTNGDCQKQCKVTVIVNVPAEFTGWNKDIIVEALPATDHANGRADGDELTFYTSDVQAVGALADASRIVISNSGTKFILAPYDENNGLEIDSYDITTLTAVKPSHCSAVSILAISDRSNDITVFATYTDDSTSDQVELNISKSTDNNPPALTTQFINAVGYNSWDYDPDEISS
ncbi:MAG: hypothetical protein K2L37_03725, partial [Lactobacillus sp.]|nr:hypothetical protein [Lactobacillus sp.]